jgi:protoheme IX farnesyltransferase
MGLGTRIKYHLQIAKVPLCLLVAFSSFFGYFLATAQALLAALFVFFGVMMLATGAATLNSVQERQADKAMGRTRNRPLVQGVISRRRGLLQAQLLLGLGFFSLYVGFPTIAPVLAGILAVFLYNFLYTPLKHKTVWAIIPGALCGAIPPYIGWLAAGGSYFSPVIMGVVALFIVWQIPHFWLVVLDNQRDYHSSDIPSMLKMMPARSLGLVSIVWVLSLVTILHIIVLLLVEVPSPGRAIISFGSFFFLIFYTYQLGFKKRLSYRFLFIALNIFMFMVMVILAYGSLEISLP